MSLLSLNNVDAAYGKTQILFDVSLDVPEGDIVTLIGRNGAGKTTTLNAIMGTNEATVSAGEIRFNGENIETKALEERSKVGIALIPEERRIFTNLTVTENLRMGYLGHAGVARSLTDSQAKVFKYFPRLEERATQKAGTLSGGEQQMLTIARALVSDPDILLIDEPTEGLMPTLVEKLGDILVRLNEEGNTILLVEQNVDLALSISDQAYILEEGRIQISDDASVLKTNDEVKDRYLTV